MTEQIYYVMLVLIFLIGFLIGWIIVDTIIWKRRS